MPKISTNFILWLNHDKHENVDIYWFQILLTSALSKRVYQLSPLKHSDKYHKKCKYQHNQVEKIEYKRILNSKGGGGLDNKMSLLWAILPAVIK